MALAEALRARRGRSAPPFQHADAVVSVSQGLTENLREQIGIDPARLHTIYNPTYREAYVRCAQDPVDHPWLLAKDQPVVIAAGRLHFVKGFDDLLEAFAIVRNARPARLIILGEGRNGRRSRPRSNASSCRIR